MEFQERLKKLMIQNAVAEQRIGSKPKMPSALQQRKVLNYSSLNKQQLDEIINFTSKTVTNPLNQMHGQTSRIILEPEKLVKMRRPSLVKQRMQKQQSIVNLNNNQNLLKMINAREQQLLQYNMNQHNLNQQNKSLKPLNQSQNEENIETTMKNLANELNNITPRKLSIPNYPKYKYYRKIEEKIAQRRMPKLKQRQTNSIEIKNQKESQVFSQLENDFQQYEKQKHLAPFYSFQKSMSTNSIPSVIDRNQYQSQLISNNNQQLLKEMLVQKDKIIQNQSLVDKIQSLQKMNIFKKYQQNCLMHLEPQNEKIKYIYNDYHVKATKPGFSRNKFGNAFQN